VISPARTKTTLTDAEYAVLGLLTSGEASGYELSANAQQNVDLILAPAKSRIYSVLPGLLARGLLTRRPVAQETRPNKQLYRLSERGWEAFRDWLNDTSSHLSRRQILLKVFFGEHADRDALLAQLRSFRQGAEEKLVFFTAVERRNLEHGEFFPNLTVWWALAMGTALLHWVDRAAAAIEEQ
jgi:PadR family transcriptional regulator, regulatory protein AphA